ncbi:MAG: uncharacterized protein KVP18_000034 [Porospora cf. gigantea A]|uniref:uncharacterized protein n=1 Tax=Porospora cf. gigantea A TaxID=2853593 RepID=UPI00355A2EDF|nr:MAG: hypothetical protein KVP18_000034 [Porospora cf. gigantea A]
MNFVDAFDPLVQATQPIARRFGLRHPPAKEELQLLNLIGRGGYGEVYEALHVVSGRKMAIKTFKSDGPGRPGIPTDGIREICVLMELRHPNILGLVAVLQAPERPFVVGAEAQKPGLWLVVELCSMDLTRFIQNERRQAQLAYYGSRHEGAGKPTARFGLSVDIIRAFVFQLLLALRYCHSRNIMHRDLKPQNILLNRSRNMVKLADFGLARKMSRPEPRTIEVVTLWYRAPEILLGDANYTYKADMWSVGCIVGEMISGFPLFPGDSEIDTLYKIFQMLGTPADCPELTRLPFYTVGSSGRHNSDGISTVEAEDQHV